MMKGHDDSTELEVLMIMRCGPPPENVFLSYILTLLGTLGEGGWVGVLVSDLSLQSSDSRSSFVSKGTTLSEAQPTGPTESPRLAGDEEGVQGKLGNPVLSQGGGSWAYSQGGSPGAPSPV